MAALKKLGHSVMPFKCGPDFIDPSLHTLVTGEVSRNLDLWMAGETFSHNSFLTHASKADISVIEGVMGMFDGGPSSSGALAEKLGVPAILVLDVRSMAESAAAVLKGFESLHPTVKPVGVILNMVGSNRHLELVSHAIEKYCQAEILGYLPRNLEFTIPSRHLGLHMGEESPVTQETLDSLAQTIIKYINIDRLLEIADRKPLKETPCPVNHVKSRIRLGVARDKAFCFYYQDNLDILRSNGAEICFFSPLEDSHLPEGIQGLYLGGGYPELYGKELSNNHSLMSEIRAWADNNGPVYAECGGFMYLTEGITDLANNFHSLVSVFPTRAIMQTKRASLGYRELTTRTSSFWGEPNTILRGHEFHYSRIEQMDETVERIYDINNNTTEGYRINNVIGGYMHIHLGSNQQAASNFIQYCKE